MSEKENIETSLIKSIAQSELKNIATDLGEVALDSLSEDGLVKDIPVIGTIAKVYSVGATVKGKIFERKIIKFLINLEEISEEKRVDFVRRITTDDKHSQKVGEHLIVLLDRMDDMNKPAYLAKLLAAYIENNIDYEMFLRLSSIIDKAFLPDLGKLHNYKKHQYGGWITTSLENLGLVYLSVVDGGSYDEDGNPTGGNRYYISDLGELMLSIIQEY
jgi:hypothetical protein